MSETLKRNRTNIDESVKTESKIIVKREKGDFICEKLMQNIIDSDD